MGDTIAVAQAPAPAPVATHAGHVVPALEVRGVTKSFGRIQVLAGVDLVVPKGSVTAVLGPSGGGKTTLLRIVAGFDQPDAGTVSIAGTVVADGRRGLPPEQRRVGVVPQEGALFPHLSVAGNVGFGLDRRERSSGRIAEVLELVGLPGIERKRPHELSGGQQHRVALARALAPSPTIVMLDEPFSSLDAGLRAQVRAEVLEALHASGATAVIVTHDQLEALSIADQVAVLLDGRIAHAAEPTEVYHRPASLEVGTFVGEAVVVTGTLDVDGHVTCALGRLAVLRSDDNNNDDNDDNDGSRTAGEVDVLLRPEQLVLSDPEDGADVPEFIGVAGRVIGRQYYGHDAVVSVRLDDDTVITARLQTAAVPPTGARVAVRAIGDVSVFGRTAIAPRSTSG